MKKVRAYVDGVGWCSAAQIETLLKSALKDIHAIGKHGAENTATRAQKGEFIRSVKSRMYRLATR